MYRLHVDAKTLRPPVSRFGWMVVATTVREQTGDDAEVVGVVVYRLIQRQVHQSLQQHQQAIPGNKGDTAMPTAAVVLESCAAVTQVSVDLDGVEICQVS